MNPASVGKLAARHNLVEFAEACRKEWTLGQFETQFVSQTCGNDNCWLLASEARPGPDD